MYPVHRGVYIQRGRGLGKIISRIFGKLIPFFGKASSKVLKSATGAAAKRVAKKSLKKLGTAALKTAANAATKAIAGDSKEDIKAGVSKDIQSARKDLANTIQSEINSREKGAKKRKKLPQNKGSAPVVRPSAGSKVAKRKKAVKSLLD